MSDKLTVTIVGSNGVSRIFTEVTRDAQKMGDSVEQSAQKSGRSLDDFKERALAIGAAFGTLIGVSSALGQAYNSQEQQIAALDRAYGASAASMKAFAEHIQDTTTFSNDAARQAELTAATLVRNYGFTADEVQRVLTVSADLAATTGMSLADATERVTAALRGEAESAEALGLTMNQQAIDRQGLTLTMSNQEAAHFRLNALLDQAAFAEGAAAEKAHTHAGEARQLANELQDLAQKAGGAIGPIGAYTSILGNLALTAPAVGAGVGKLGGLFGEMGAGAAAAEIALGPVGLAAAALAAGAGIVYLMTQVEDYNAAANAATATTTNLTNLLTSIAATLDPARAKIVLNLMDEINQTVTDAAARQQDLNNIIDLQIDMQSKQQTSLDLTNESVVEMTTAYTGLTEAQLRFIDSNGDMALTIDEVNAAVERYQANTDRLNADQLKRVNDDIASIMTKPGLNFAKFAGDLRKWEEALNQGDITGEEFAAMLDNAATNYSQYVDVTTKSTAATNTNTVAVKSQTQAVQDLNAAVALAIEIRDKEAAAENDAIQNNKIHQNARRRAADESIKEQREAGVMTAALRTEIDALGTSMAATALVTERTGVTSDYLTHAMEAEADRISKAKQALADYRAALGQNHAIVNDHAANMARGANIASDALSAGFQAIVGNTNAVGQQSQQVADWAANLGAANLAMDAGNRIAAANAAIQADILKIQRDQAPVLAGLMEATEGYYDDLAKLTPAQQTVRLGYMDSAESAKAYAAAQMAAAAAAGELGAAGEETATKMIVAAAQADPILKAMLQDMGLISVGADGTITVNFDSVSGADSEMNKLIDKLDLFIDMIAQVLGIEIDSSSAVTAQENVDAAHDALDRLNGQSADVSVNVGGNFTILDEIRAQVIGLDGLSAQLNVNTVHTDTYQTTGAGTETGSNRLGGVVGYAGGGVVARMGEAGAELLHFANGGTALALTDGLYSVPRGTYVDTAPATKAKLAGVGGVTIQQATFVFNGFTTRDQVQRQIAEFAHGGSRQ